MDLSQRRQNLFNFIVLYIVFLSLFQYSDADCSITTPGVHTFGSECQYMCHCKNGESCNTTTGECTSGCDRHWFGPGCQYSDLAENKFARHASNIPQNLQGSRGNDGDTSTCSYTQDAINSAIIPWWRVVLDNEVTITDIYILTTNDGLKYFPDFEVTVEKLSYGDRYSHNRPTDTSLCYKHDITVPDSTSIYVTCTTPLIGNQVRITLSKIESQLILCDVRINQGRNLAFKQSVTSSAVYNNDSQYQSSYAVDGLVSPAAQCFRTGNFSNKWLQVELDQIMDVNHFNICKYNDDYINNYKIYDTTYVKELLYDSGSDQSPTTRGHLNRNLQKIRVEKTLGGIMAICELKLYGDCPTYQCGYDCSTICHCKTLKSLEDKISGICTSGCEGRWTGGNGKCDIECSDNKWGTSCQNDCGACRQGTCDVVSGKCTGDCQDGYYNTDDCKTECNSGTYGYNCQSICSDHCQNSCSKINGKCIDGCKPGYMGDKCEQECSAGTFGQTCGHTCNENCIDTCHHVSGNCTSCKAGWIGNSCDTECNNGTYGHKCQSSCSDNCQNSCNKVNGTCIGGCKPGYLGDKCKQECTVGAYGPNCNEQCNSNCVDICNRITGKCTKCMAGWKGDHCDEECDDGTYDINCENTCTDKCLIPCNKVNGVCTLCQAGWTGSACDYECPDGTYGISCNAQCNSNCVDICNNATGKCTQCKAGWKGDLCDQAEEQFSSFPVAIVTGSLSAFVVIVIIVTIVCLFYLRRRLALKSRANTELTNRGENDLTHVNDNEGAYWTELQRQDSTLSTSQEKESEYDTIGEKEFQ